MKQRAPMGLAQIVSKYSFCTLQDRGRSGYRHLGVPGSGPMDENAWEFVNQLVGNRHNEAVLEVGMTPLTLRFEGMAKIAIVAGVGEVTINGKAQNQAVLFIKPNDELHLGQAGHFPYRYIAITGGWQGEEVLGSRSTLPSLGMKAWQKDNYLYFLPWLGEQHALEAVATYSPLPAVIPVYPGPDFAWADLGVLQEYLDSPITLDLQANRQAYGWVEKLPISKYPNRFDSVGSLPGMIQLTPSGKMFVLMRDAQTTGGYLQVLYLAPNYLSNLAQHMPGSKLRFRLVAPEKVE